MMWYICIKSLDTGLDDCKLIVTLACLINYLIFLCAQEKVISTQVLTESRNTNELLVMPFHLDSNLGRLILERTTIEDNNCQARLENYDISNLFIYKAYPSMLVNNDKINCRLGVETNENLG